MALKELIKKLLSFLIGIVFCWCVGKYISNAVETQTLKFINPNFAEIVYWMSFFMFIFYFGWCGIRKLQEFWCGVPTILGLPIPWYVIPSGYFWQLPEPFMSFIPVYMGQRDLDVPEVTALSRDQKSVTMDAQIQARVTEPYEWANVEDANKALITLGERNLRVLINNYLLIEIPGLKQQFSKDLEEGVFDLPVYDENGQLTGRTEILKSVKEEASMWGFRDGIDKCLVNKISIPKEITDANANADKEKADSIAESIQQDLLYKILGANDVEEGKKAWLSMKPEERAKIAQAERGKRIVVTVDGNSGDFTKGQVAAAAMNKRS